MKISSYLLKIKKLKNISNYALMVAAGSFLGRFLGYIRDVAIAYRFSSIETDLLFLAYRIPNMLRRSLSEGLMGAAFIPFYTSVEAKNKLKAEQFQNAVFWGILVSFLFVLLLCISFSSALLSSVWQQNAYFHTISSFMDFIRLHRLLWIFAYLFCISSFLTAVLNLKSKFFIPAAASSVVNVFCIIAALCAPYFKFNLQIEIIAYAIVFGGVVQLAILNHLSKEIKLAWHWNWSWAWRVIEASVPVAISLGAFPLLSMLAAYWGAKYTQGIVSSLYYADRLVEFPLGLAVGSLAVALMPALSRANGNVLELLVQILHYLRKSLIVIVPISLLCFSASEEIVRLLFFRGKFNQVDLYRTVYVLKTFSFSILIFSIHRIFVSFYHVQKLYWRSAIYVCLSLGLFYLNANVFRGLSDLKIMLQYFTLCSVFCVSLHFIDMFRWQLRKFKINDMYEALQMQFLVILSELCIGFFSFLILHFINQIFFINLNIVLKIICKCIVFLVPYIIAVKLVQKNLKHSEWEPLFPQGDLVIPKQENNQTTNE